MGTSTSSSLGRTRTRRHRRFDVIVLALAAPLLAGAAAAIGVAAASTERVTGLWAAAAVDTEGNGRITEVIDYDFGRESRHGIFRDVPGLRSVAPIIVTSATAPADVLVEGSRIRVGNPSQLVTGRHRYTVMYGLDAVAANGQLAWDAVGTEWRVGIHDIEIHVVAPFEFGNVRCSQGPAEATAGCSVVQPEPAHLVVKVDSLRPREGVTLFASAGPPLDAPPLPAAPSGALAGDAIGWDVAGLLAAVVAIVAVVPTSRLVRLAGRERLATDSVAALSLGASGTANEIRIDAERLASIATIEVAPPAELTAPQGGVLVTETVREEHKVAWLVSAAVDGHLAIEGTGVQTTLVRLRPPGRPAEPILEVAFSGRERLPLNSYDQSFAAAWQALDDELSAWRRTSGLWDAAADRRSTRLRLVGGGVAVGGLALTVLGGALVERWGPAWFTLMAAAAFLAGVGMAALVRGWELRVRTPAGTALWLRVESFRRYLAQAGAQHADEAASRGVLQEYTAWAVAFGEENRWAEAAASSAAGAADPDLLLYPAIAGALPYATSAGSNEPASTKGSNEGGWSGSDGGTSDSGVGRGVGGGGGGSW